MPSDYALAVETANNHEGAMIAIGLTLGILCAMIVWEIGAWVFKKLWRKR